MEQIPIKRKFWISIKKAKIILRLNELNRMKGADDEKLQTLNAEFRRKFSVTLGDIVADHEDY